MNTSRSCLRVPPLPSKRSLSQLKSAESTVKVCEPEHLSKEVENQNPNCGDGLRKKRTNAVSIRIPGMRSNISSEGSVIRRRLVERKIVSNKDEKEGTNSDLRSNGEGNILDDGKLTTGTDRRERKGCIQYEREGAKSDLPRNTERSILEDGKLTTGTDRRERKDFTTRPKRKNQLLSSRLKGLKGNSMRAKRVVIQEPVTLNVEGNKESYDKEKSILDDSLLKSSEVKSAVKIPKLDLRYMLDWDPQAHRSHSYNNENTAPSTRLQQSLDTIRESGQTPSQTKSENISQSSSQSISQSSSQSTNQTSSQNTTQTSGQRQNAIADSSFPLGVNELSSEYKGEKTNSDFLPIVREKNMIYVNDIPYSKLSVIGKGGSCKVYRVLSKDRNIVAIKKVKLAGMKRKAIEGYANEIALLRRLRENPAIIQMYDSQVDLERKAIYLVMEVGEADLNHVVSLRNTYAFKFYPINSRIHCITF